MSKVSAEHAGQPDKNGQMKVISVIEILEPKVVCTETYLVIGSFDEISQANNLVSYMKTKFFRFCFNNRFTRKIYLKTGFSLFQKKVGQKSGMTKSSIKI